MRYLFVVIALLVLPCSLLASDDLVNDIDHAHRFVDSEITGLAEDVDSIIGGRKAWEDGNTTYFELSQEVYGGEIDDFSQFFYRFRLRLPQTENRIHLFIHRQKDTYLEPTAKEPRFGKRVRQKRHRAGLRFDHIKTKHFDTSLKTGVHLLGGLKMTGLDAFAEYLMNYHTEFSKFVHFETSLTPSYYIDEKFELEWGTSLDYSPLKLWVFRLSNGLSWLEALDELSLSQGISAAHHIQDKKIVSLAYSVNSSNKSTFHLQSYQWAATYGQPLIWDWISLSVSLVNLFEKAKDFKGEIGYGGVLSVKLGG